MAQAGDDDFQDQGTAGYKTSAKISLADAASLNDEDEALRKYKESLGIKVVAPIFPEDSRDFLVDKFVVSARGRDPVEFSPDAAAHHFVLKEGCCWNLTIRFWVQREIQSALKYFSVVKRRGITVSKDQQTLGSYAPSEDKAKPHVFNFPEEEVGTGMLIRGSYAATILIRNEDGEELLRFQFSFDIKKNW